MASTPQAAITKDWRGYKVAFPHRGQQHAVHSIKTLLTADLVCDTLAVMEAVVEQQPVDCVHLRSRRSDHSRPQLSASAGRQLQGVVLEEAVRQLQACVSGMARLPAGMSFAAAHTATSAAAHLLFAAAASGQAAAAQLLLLVAPECVAATEQHGSTAMHAAASGCHLNIIHLLMHAAPNAVEATDRHGRLPLHLAAAAHVEGAATAAALSLLLNQAPNTVTEPTHDGDMPLHHAVRATRWSKSTEAVQLLLQRAPAAANTAHAANGRTGHMPLHVAATAGHLPTIELLLQVAADTAGAQDHEGNYPLHLAAADGNAAAVQLLLAAGPAAAVTARGRGGLLPLALALQPSRSIQSTDCRQAAARCLLAAGPASMALAVLRHAGPSHGWPLIPEAVAARVPLDEHDWETVPFHCPRLGHALPAALAHSPQQTRQLMRRLPRSDLVRLRLLALCLARVQRRMQAALPPGLLQQLLCLAVI